MAQRDLSKKEKRLLQYMGKQPDLTNEELCRTIGFRYAEYVSTLQKKLRKAEYLMGPYMFPDFGRIFRNKVSRVYVFIMFDGTYDYICSFLQEIDCWYFFYPLEEGVFHKYLVSFMNTDTEKLKRIFDYLMKNGIIHYYHLFEQEDNWRVINPTFLAGDEDAPADPDFDHLFDDVLIPDLGYGSFEGMSLSQVAVALIEHLSVGREGCDLKRIVRAENKYREKCRKELRDSLRGEKDDENRKKIALKLEELKDDLPLREFREAYQLLAEHQVLEKVYYVWPFPQPRSTLWLMLRCSSLELTKRVIFNFGKNVRIFTRVSMVKSVETGKWYGTIYVVGNPFFGQKLMTDLDLYPEIVDRRLFPTRSYPATHWKSQSIPIEGYYNSETRSLEYPYDLYYERVRQKVEEESIQRREARALV